MMLELSKEQGFEVTYFDIGKKTHTTLFAQSAFHSTNVAPCFAHLKKKKFITKKGHEEVIKPVINTKNRIYL